MVSISYTSREKQVMLLITKILTLLPTSEFLSTNAQCVKANFYKTTLTVSGKRFCWLIVSRSTASTISYMEKKIQKLTEFAVPLDVRKLRGGCCDISECLVTFGYADEIIKANMGMDNRLPIQGTHFIAALTAGSGNNICYVDLTAKAYFFPNDEYDGLLVIDSSTNSTVINALYGGVSWYPCPPLVGSDHNYQRQIYHSFCNGSVA